MDKDSTTADALELLLLSQTALRAGIEELSRWVSDRGSVETHESVMVALTVMDQNSESIVKAIDALRE